MKGVKYNHDLVNKLNKKNGWLMLYKLHRYAESEEGQAVIKKTRGMIVLDDGGQV